MFARPGERRTSFELDFMVRIRQLARAFTEVWR